MEKTKILAGSAIFESDWVPTVDAAEKLHLGVSTLRELRREGHLIAGTHYYTAGAGRHSPVIWSVSAIRQTLLERTAEVEKAAKDHANKLETYERRSTASA